VKIARSVGMVFLVAMLAGALSGCGCFYQAMKGEAAPASPPSAIVQTPEKPAPGNEMAAPAQQGAEGTGTEVAALKDIHFDFDRYSIRREDAEILKQGLGWFQENPGTHVRIEGNCDERGTVEYNLVLGQKRADAAKNYLTTLGIDQKMLETISYGKERPVDPGHNEESWAKNRRDHFVSLK
jgi:peptidoglycan-associated lipoprotein